MEYFVSAVICVALLYLLVYELPAWSRHQDKLTDAEKYDEWLDRQW